VLLTARYENISWLFYYAEDQKQYPGNEWTTHLLYPSAL
jgi:hypothetical protein